MTFPIALSFYDLFCLPTKFHLSFLILILIIWFHLLILNYLNYLLSTELMVYMFIQKNLSLSSLSLQISTCRKKLTYFSTTMILVKRIHLKGIESLSQTLIFLEFSEFVARTQFLSEIQRISNTSEEKSVRVLGVLLDEKLKLRSHVNSICSKISRSIYCLSQVKNLLDISCLKLIYFAHIHSHLNYCSYIFSLLSKKDLIRVQTLQKNVYVYSLQ